MRCSLSSNFSRITPKNCSRAILNCVIKRNGWSQKDWKCTSDETPIFLRLCILPFVYVFLNEEQSSEEQSQHESTPKLPMNNKVRLLLRTNQITACMPVCINICFRFEIQPSLRLYKFRFTGLCYPDVFISSARFLCSFGLEICVVLLRKSFRKFLIHASEDVHPVHSLQSFVLELSVKMFYTKFSLAYTNL